MSNRLLFQLPSSTSIVFETRPEHLDVLVEMSRGDDDSSIKVVVR
ncbi:MAG: hypothetical protein ABSA26_18420 [Thermoguttaceae bacterium]|jgi:hypothetical protein